MHAVDEEAPGPHWRQARQRHGQPVGVGQGFHGHSQFGIGGQRRLQSLDLVVRRWEGVDAPDVVVFVLLEDRIGRTLQGGVGVDGFCRGFSHGARAAGDDLERLVGHAAPSNAMGRLVEAAASHLLRKRAVRALRGQAFAWGGNLA